MNAKIPKPALADNVHIAQVDKDSNIVLNTLVIPILQGHRGQDFMSKDLKHPHKGKWITFFPGDVTKPGLNSVGPGSTYVERLNGFIPRQPFPSWTLNESTFLWEPPIPRPGATHMWNEDTQTWYDPFVGTV